VLARDLKTGKQKVVEMKSAVDVDDAAVQKMIEESVGHALEDMQARQWIETTVKATEILAAARKGFAEHNHELDAVCKRAIESTIIQLEDALASEDPQTKVGDSNRLKAAIRAVDEATQPLADLMMDKAMEAALRKQGMIQ
jgi:molecular chaperone DnaK